MDHYVLRAITDGLRDLGVDVLTAFEDGSHELLDPDSYTFTVSNFEVLTQTRIGHTLLWNPVF